MKKNLLFLVFLVLIIAVGLLSFQLGIATGRKSLEPKVAQYKKVIDYYFPAPEEIFSVSGKITEIKNNVLSIETTVQNPYVLPDEWKAKIVKVNVINETEITKFDIETGKETEIGFSDLKVGNKISARAKENIKDKTEFEAQSIEIIIIPVPTGLK